MSYVLVCTTALLVSGLTLFSGFGLGTLLMPVFALFFPVEVAVAATAIVHLANNLFKALLLGRHADRSVVARFAAPAALAAMAGAFLLNHLGGMEPIARFDLAGRACTISWIKLVIALLIMGFAMVELSPGLEKLPLDARWIPVGGLVSGFFGGLSGHQGALRAAFLVRAGLSREAFIGTVILSAIVVDISRVTVYGLTFFARDFEIMRAQGGFGLVVAGSLAALLGAFLGSRLLRKVTMHGIRRLVGILLLLLGAALGVGLV